MRIAQIAPLYESVPPKFYGGTERIVSYLTEELVRQKQEVTLFASGDSETRARLVPITERALRLDGSRVKDPLAHHVRLIERALRKAGEFDILHFHLDHLHFPLVRRTGSLSVTTLHGRLDIPDLAPLFQEFSEMPVVSISDAQRKPLAWLNWCGTWPEPFGLVMIEALACGTPVIAFNRGSVPEIIENGKTGFVVRDVEEAVSAVGKLAELDRGKCREAFDQRFSATRMATNYLEIYHWLVSRRDGRGISVFKPAA